jgi:hypothetical protein
VSVIKYFLGIFAAIFLVIGFGLGCWLCHEKKPEPNPYLLAPKPALIQKDGSVVVAREAADKKTLKKVTMPTGYHEDRRITMVYTPVPIDNNTCSCEPINADISLISNASGDTRIVASAKGAEVSSTDSRDIILTLAEEAPKHSISVSRLVNANLYRANYLQKIGKLGSTHFYGGGGLESNSDNSVNASVSLAFMW